MYCITKHQKIFDIFERKKLCRTCIDVLILIILTSTTTLTPMLAMFLERRMIEK